MIDKRKELFILNTQINKLQQDLALMQKYKDYDIAFNISKKLTKLKKDRDTLIN